MKQVAVLLLCLSSTLLSGQILPDSVYIYSYDARENLSQLKDKIVYEVRNGVDDYVSNYYSYSETYGVFQLDQSKRYIYNTTCEDKRRVAKSLHYAVIDNELRLRQEISHTYDQDCNRLSMAVDRRDAQTGEMNRIMTKNLEDLDPMGRARREYRMNQNGEASLALRHEYEYDGNGNMIAHHMYRGEEVQSHMGSFITYDSESRVVQRSAYHSVDRAIKDISTYEYLDGTRVNKIYQGVVSPSTITYVDSTFFNSEGEVLSTRKYRYNNEIRSIEMFEYREYFYSDKEAVAQSETRTVEQPAQIKVRDYGNQSADIIIYDLDEAKQYQLLISDVMGRIVWRENITSSTYYEKGLVDVTGILITTVIHPDGSMISRKVGLR